VWKKKFIKKTLIFISHTEKSVGEKLAGRQNCDMHRQFDAEGNPGGEEASLPATKDTALHKESL